MVNRIYPPELQLNKANTSDTEAPFLDLHLSISIGFVSSKIYHKRDDFDFDIVNFPFLEWKVSIFKIVDQRIKFYSQNTNLLPPKPKSTFQHLKQGIQDFHRKYVLVPADNAANNVVVV